MFIDWVAQSFHGRLEEERKAAQRPFVELTDEEISDIAINNPPMVHEFARAIEAKLKEKNSDR